MNMEWINVADTAVKIGLGGVVSGIFTYMGLKYSHKSQQSKYVFEHKIKLVEQITADIDDYFTAFSSMTSLIHGIAKTRKIRDLENQPLNDIQWEKILSDDNLLVLSRAKKTYAVAKLTLLKANIVVENLDQCTSLENELREKILFNKEIYTLDEISDFGQKLKIAKLQVHSSLSDFYDSLLK